MKIYDQHVHTRFSPDSTTEVGEYLEIVNKNGKKHFVCTDHVDFKSVSLGFTTVVDFKSQAEELEKHKYQYPDIKILKGVEIGFRGDFIPDIERILNENSFDIVLLSVHDNSIIDFYVQKDVKKFGIIKALNSALDCILDSVNTITNYNVLAHIDFAYKTAYLIDDTLKFSQFEEKIIKILNKIISDKKSLEINTNIQRFLPIEHTTYLLSLYKRLGGTRLTISSDAHTPERFEQHFEHYISLIKQQGFDKLMYYIDMKEYFVTI